VYLKNDRAAKFSITLPKELANEVRFTVPKRRVSAFFAEAIKRYMAQYKQRVALEKGFGAWSIENHPELKAPEDTVIYVRRLRESYRERLTDH